MKATGKTISIHKGGENLLLCPEKVIFVPEKKVLLMADLHLGKVTHFRKAGIPGPDQARKTDFRKLNDTIELYNPEKVILLGDLFHSNYNSCWDDFVEFIDIYQTIDFSLVIGNHDILSSPKYEKSRLTLHDQSLSLGDLVLTHEPLDHVPEGKYNLYGHLHPGVRLIGGSKQTLRLPCFHFNENQGVLPAFGRFTGLYIIAPKAGDEVFAITANAVIKVSD